MMVLALLLLVAMVHLGPEHLADAFGHSRAAWDYVAAGTETAALWALLGVLWRSVPARAICAWGAVESALRPACRLALPMDRPPPPLMPGENLCDVATGHPIGWLSLAAACWVAALALTRGPRP